MGHVGKHARTARAAEATATGGPLTDVPDPPHGIEILHDRFPDDDAALDADADSATAAGCEAEDPDDYGVRVAWQSEAVRIEAAEFLVATRIQQDARLRAAHDLERLRKLEQR
ncbi:MAG: hypothetical protein ACRDWY_16710 [Actinomycetes bacterium]